MMPDQPAPVVSTKETNSILILDDGRVLVRNLTPPLAALLRKLNPGDTELAFRVGTTDHRGAASDSDANDSGKD